MILIITARPHPLITDVDMDIEKVLLVVDDPTTLIILMDRPLTLLVVIDMEITVLLLLPQHLVHLDHMITIMDLLLPGRHHLLVPMVMVTASKDRHLMDPPDMDVDEDTGVHLLPDMVDPLRHHHPLALTAEEDTISLLHLPDTTMDVGQDIMDLHLGKEVLVDIITHHHLLVPAEIMFMLMVMVAAMVTTPNQLVGLPLEVMVILTFPGSIIIIANTVRKLVRGTNTGTSKGVNILFSLTRSWFDDSIDNSMLIGALDSSIVYTSPVQIAFRCCLIVN